MLLILLLMLLLMPLPSTLPKAAGKAGPARVVKLGFTAPPAKAYVNAAFPSLPSSSQSQLQFGSLHSVRLPGVVRIVEDIGQTVLDGSISSGKF